ncbi:hypothetical protein [Megalodesulfovibrio paquesii]
MPGTSESMKFQCCRHIAGLSWRSCLARAAATGLLAAVLCLLHPPVSIAKMIEVDKKNFGTRDFGVSQGGVFRGVILNVSTNTLAGLEVEIVAQDAQGNELWTRTTRLPTLRPNQRAPLEFEVGMQGVGQPASYLITYRMDDAVGKDPDRVTSTQRRLVGFTVKGVGDFRTRPFSLEAGEKTIQLEYSGEDTLVVTLQKPDGSYERPLFEQQGAGNATVKFSVEEKGEYVFHTDGDGGWSLQVRDEALANMPPPAPNQEFATPGDATPGAAQPAAPAPARPKRNSLVVE